MTIAYYIASPTWGGGEQYVFDLARHMKDIYKVHPFFLFPANSDPAMIARFSEIGEAAIFPFAGKIWRFTPYAGRQLAKILDAHNADILHINSRQTYFIAAWAKQHAYHRFRLIATQHLARPAKSGPFWEWIYRHIDVLVCVSRLVRDQYLKPLEWKAAFPNVQVVYNSVPFHCEEDGIAKSDFSIPQILFHGRICREKGIVPLFMALEKIADLPFRITFAGHIEKKDQHIWKELMEKSSVRDKIEYIGFCNDIHSMAQKFQIGVSPSIIPEAGSLSLLDDMAMGLAIITSSSGSQPEIIRHEKNGLLCPPDDPDALASALRRLLTDKTLTQRLGQQALDDFCTQFRYEKFLQEICDIYFN